MSAEIFEKINELREVAEGRDPESLRVLDSARDILKKALIKQALAKHEGVAMLLTFWQRQLKAINGLLQEDDKMTEIERARYFGEKRGLERSLRFFSTADRNVEVINRSIDQRYDREMV